MRYVLGVVCGLGMILATAVESRCAACGQGCTEEPFIKFLDDLCNPCGAHSDRDPYEERIETDRHDFTQSTKTVGRGVVQFEGGYTFFYEDTGEEVEKSHTTPELMMRYGITEDIEFRLRWDYAWRFITEQDDIDGAEDLRWAFKLGMTDQQRWLPESALEIRFTAPTGGNAWTTERVEFGLDYIYGWKIAEFFTLYGSTGLATNALADFSLLPEEPASDRFIVWSQSAAVGFELSESNAVYIEYYGLFSHALADNVSIAFINVGLDHYLTSNFVIDFRVGVGVTEDAEDVFAGFGGGYRY